MTPNNTEYNKEIPEEKGREAFLDKSRRLILGSTGLFVLSILAVFPVIFKNYYFDILRVKYYYYLISAGVMAVLLGGALIYIIAADKKQFEGSILKAARLRWKEENKTLLARMPYIGILAFLAAAAISTFTSDYLYEAFWGNEGRFSGLFLLLVYGATFLIISIFFKLERWYLNVFLISTMIVSGLGILDFLGMDILQFKNKLEPVQWEMFTSTIGNINTYTAFLSLSLGVSCIMYASSRKRSQTLLYFGAMMVIFLAMITGRSDNTYLSMAAIFGFAPLYLFREKEGVRRYVVMLAGLFTSIWLVELLCQTWPGETYRMEGIFNVLSEFDGLVYVAAGLWLLAALLYGCKHVKKDTEVLADRRLRFIWTGFLIAAAVLVIFAFIDVNLWGHAERYGSFRGYLEFNDDWGTQRGWAWKQCMVFFEGFSPWKKLFGYGPDTFGILVVNEGLHHEIGGIFDTAHNEYLQYLVTIGLIGLTTYLIFMISCAVYMLKKASDHPLVMAIFFAVFCYQAQAVVNLNVPISAAVMWVLLAMGVAGSRNLWKTRKEPEAG